jgi:O-antigen/teichoic acid export membrane protein
VMTVGLILVTVSTRLIGSATGGGMIVAEQLSRPQVTTALKFNIASCLTLSAVIALLSVPMANAFSDGSNALVIEVLGLGVAFYGPSIVPLALLSTGLLFKRRAAVQAGAIITASTTAVVVGLLGEVWSLVIRQLLDQALLTSLGWAAARRLIPPHTPGSEGSGWQRLAQRGAVGFMLFSLTDLVVFHADYLVVGHFASTAELGLYSVAFTIAFAPVSQISTQLGPVLLPAAAASEPDAMRRRTIVGVRLGGLVLLPVVLIALVLAPVLVQALLGERWRGAWSPCRSSSSWVLRTRS